MMLVRIPRNACEKCVFSIRNKFFNKKLHTTIGTLLSEVNGPSPLDDRMFE